MSNQNGAAVIELNRARVYCDRALLLSDVSLTVEKGRHLAILGPNGSGKSSLIKLISGRLRPSFQEDPPACRIFGRTRWNIWELRSLMGVVTPELEMRFYHDCTGRETILSGFFGTVGLWDPVEPKQIEKADSIIELLGVGPVVDRLMSTLSTGEARKCFLGRALVHSPQVLVLDEPTSGLDIRAAAECHRTLQRLIQAGTTLVLTTHQLQDILPEIESAALVKGGRIMAWGAKDQVLTSENLSRLFDTPLQVRRWRDRFQAFIDDRAGAD